MSPECDFFSGENGILCNRVEALRYLKDKNEYELAESQIKELICTSGDDLLREVDCPAFVELMLFKFNNTGTDFVVRTD